MSAGQRQRAVRRWPVLIATVIVAALALTSCAAPTYPRPTASGPVRPHRQSAPPDPVANMTLAQQVGQLFMVGTSATGAEPVTLESIANLHVGNVFLSGRSHLGVGATAGIVDQLQSEVDLPTTDSEPLLVATDQEGGEVQVLQGPGFSTMPTALGQGAMSATALHVSAGQWADELHAAGVNMNLAPVVDLLPSLSAAPSNPPIGVFQREFGFTPATIESHADAFRTAMSAAHVISVLKHFPGLGHVTGNTDTSRNVTDSVIDANSPDVGIYRSEIAAGAQCIMMSLAVYSKLDAMQPAVFSRKVVTGLLRDQLGFTGVIITDDLSATAQVAYLSPADRAIDAIEAGADVVLVSASPGEAPQMVEAVLAKAETDPAFAAIVAAAARRVVELKENTLPPRRGTGVPQPRASTVLTSRPRP